MVEKNDTAKMCKEINVMDEALVVWFRNCCEDPANIKSLDLLLQEKNFKHVYKIIIGGHVEDYEDDEVQEAGKHYLEILLEQICLFYQKYLNQTVVRLPNIEKIVKDPKENFADTHLLLLLLIGCATQCHEKFWFYEKIAQLDSTSFFSTVNHLKKIRELLKDTNTTSMTRSSRFLKHFSESFSFGNKHSFLQLKNSKNQQSSDKRKSVFDYDEDCPLSPIYQIKIQRDQIKLCEADMKIKKFESQIKCQNEIIDALKREYESKMNKQNQLISNFNKENVNSNGDMGTGNWMLRDDMTKAEAELVYKIEMYNNLLNEVAKEWSKEEIKYKQLSEEITRIKRLIQFDNAKQSAKPKVISENNNRDSFIDSHIEEYENNLDASINVPDLIKMFENKNTNQHDNVLKIKDKIFAAKNDAHNVSGSSE